MNKKAGLLSVVQKQTLSALDDEDDDGEEKYNDVELDVKDETLSNVSIIDILINCSKTWYWSNFLECLTVMFCIPV